MNRIFNRTWIRSIPLNRVRHIQLNKYSSRILNKGIERAELYKEGIFAGLVLLGGYFFFKDHLSHKFEIFIQNQLNELDIVKQLNMKKNFSNTEPIEDVEGYVKLHELFSEEAKQNMATQDSLTQTIYRSPNRIPIPPQTYYNERLQQTFEIGYIGSELSNHKGSIHEGVISSLLDEAFAKLAFQKFKTHHLFTANLSIDFKSPLSKDDFYIIQTNMIPNNKNYKAELKAKVFDLERNVVAEANSLFIVPKYARDQLPS